MNLAAVDLEGFEGGEGVSFAITVAGVAEIQPEEDEAELFIDSGEAISDVRVRDDRWGLDVFAARARSRTGHHLTVLEAIGIGSKRRVDRSDAAADFESDGITFGNSDRFGARQTLRLVRHDLHLRPRLPQGFDI